ncbi:MAG: hypothetical protein Q7R93_00600 [bacterium]|nr:hypothetical protein [bacterium]
MENKKALYVGVAVAIVAVIFFVFWSKSQREKLILANPPIEQLLFLTKAEGEFTPEQQRSIGEFKEKVLARVRLGVELTETEKQNFTVVISDREAIFANGNMVVNHFVLKFSDEEINLISNALKK